MPHYKSSQHENMRKRMKRTRLYKNFTGLVFLGVAAVGVSSFIATEGEILTDVDGTTYALKANNLKPIKVGGYSFNGCGKGDFFATEFVAENQQGKRVYGVGCSNLFKATTLRFMN